MPSLTPGAIAIYIRDLLDREFVASAAREPTDRDRKSEAPRGMSWRGFGAS